MVNCLLTMDAILPRPKAFIYMKQRAVPFLYPPMWDFERHSNNMTLISKVDAD